MTVEELIKKLQKYPKETKIWVNTIDEYGHYGGMSEDVELYLEEFKGIPYLILDEKDKD